MKRIRNILENPRVPSWYITMRKTAATLLRVNPWHSEHPGKRLRTSAALLLLEDKYVQYRERQLARRRPRHQDCAGAYPALGWQGS